MKKSLFLNTNSNWEIFEYQTLSELHNEFINRGIILGKDVVIGDNVRINDEVEIGDKGIVGHKTTIGKESVIGKNTIIGSVVTIGTKTEIKNNVEIGKNAQIGNDVIIADDCIIGSWATIVSNVVIEETLNLEGSVDALHYYGQDEIQIGFLTESISSWKDSFQRNLQSQGYSPKSIKEYASYINMVDKMHNA